MSVAVLIAGAGHRVDVQRPAAGTTVTGGRAGGNWATRAAAVACWVQPIKTWLRLQYQQRQVAVSHRVYFAADPGVVAEDRLLFGTRTLRVVGGGCPGELSQFWYVDCEEVKGG